MAKSNKKFVNIKPHDATTIQIGEYVTVLDAVYDIDPELIQEMCKDAEPGEGHTFTMHPYIDIERAKGQIFKVESVNYPLVLCSHRDPCDNPLGPSVWDLRRVRLAPISGHYRRRMRAIYLATRAYHQALTTPPHTSIPKGNDMKVITLPSPPPMANPIDLVAYMLSPQRPEREDEPLDDEEEDDTPDDPRD